jgi:hypothetical protein
VPLDPKRAPVKASIAAPMETSPRGRGVDTHVGPVGGGGDLVAYGVGYLGVDGAGDHGGVGLPRTR